MLLVKVWKGVHMELLLYHATSYMIQQKESKPVISQSEICCLYIIAALA